MVTIKDVAKAAGVSIASVSRVMSGQPGVGPATRKRIQRVARELGYRPHSAARGLVKQQTGNIGLVIPRGTGPVFSNPFFYMVLEGTGGSLDRVGYNFLLSLYPEQYRRMVETRLVDGFMLFAVRLGDPYIARIEETGLPAVILGSYVEESRLPNVRPDDEGGGYQAVSHLMEYGHRRIALLNGPLDSMQSVYFQKGALAALAEDDLEPVAVLNIEFTQESAYEAALELLDRKERPTALALVSDVMAPGVLLAASELKLQVPQDVSIVGAGDFPSSPFLMPPLSSVDRSLFELGREGGEMLLKLLQGETLEQSRLVLPTHLISRQSVARIG